MARAPVTLDYLRKTSIEFIPQKLYFASFNGPPPTGKDVHCFSIDNHFIYEEFCLDFGPLHLGHTYNFCMKLKRLLEDERRENARIYYYCKNDKRFRANAATLICAYMILCEGKSPDEAFSPLLEYESTFEPFHDASFYPCPFILTVKDCIEGIYKAWQLEYFQFPNFDIEDYEFRADIENGDLNWLVDGKFLAFTGPFEQRKHYGNGYYSSIPSDFLEYFKEKNVTAIIRLNKRCYSAKTFTDAGFNHYDLFYPDGGNPPPAILDKFIEICEKERGAIAVHCKAGLGRTGTCIGMYLMKHFDITAREVIGYFRVARPGSIIGPQQDFLVDHEKKMHLRGKAYRKRMQEKELQQEENKAQHLRRRKTQMVEQNDIMVNLRSSYVSKDGKVSLYGNQDGNEIDTEEESMDIISDVSRQVDARQRIEQELQEALDVDDTQGDILNKLKAQHHLHHNVPESHFSSENQEPVEKNTES